MKTVLKKLKSGKSPGHDNIKADQLKYMGKTGEQMLLHLLNQA